MLPLVKSSHLVYITLQYRTQDSLSKISQQHLGDEDEKMAPFYKNPMTRLKRLELEGSVCNSESESFKDIFNFFPCLETLTISLQAGFLYVPIQDLISVLNSFGDIKNISLSNFSIRLTGIESYDATMESNIFQEAVKIIDGKFPVETTEIKICGKRPPDGSIDCNCIIKEKGIQPFMKDLSTLKCKILNRE
jgi:hypothetical protein